jgi:methylenetetrahydrofolate dehydrogenase (NADP+)/methenyltetrahydrofolate cyclohydrolase
MSAKIIDGKQVAQEMRAEIKAEVEKLKAQDVVPGLVTILVGENPASQSYVTAKQKTSHDLGFHSVQENLEADISEEKLLALVDQYNNDPAIHGILVQLPLPKHINENKVLLAIDPKKDVDGFHPTNVGKLMIGDADFLPCTPAGIQQLLIRSGVETEGAEVVVVGRSNIVGKPIANILLQKQDGANATVTICHTRTKDMASHTKRADILIVAAGFVNAVTADMVKDGAVVIDVGVNRVGEKESVKTPGKMVAILKGDVDFDAIKEKASAITPVPGGVGPMTITMLMYNTLKSAKIFSGIDG